MTLAQLPKLVQLGFHDSMCGFPLYDTTASMLRVTTFVQQTFTTLGNAQTAG